MHGVREVDASQEPNLQPGVKGAGTKARAAAVAEDEEEIVAECFLNLF